MHGGHVVIAHLFHGGAGSTPCSAYGAYFSGAPNAYPVVAAALDSVGGLIVGPVL